MSAGAAARRRAASGAAAAAWRRRAVGGRGRSRTAGGVAATGAVPRPSPERSRRRGRRPGSRLPPPPVGRPARRAMRRPRPSSTSPVHAPRTGPRPRPCARPPRRRPRPDARAPTPPRRRTRGARSTRAAARCRAATGAAPARAAAATGRSNATVVRRSWTHGSSGVSIDGPAGRRRGAPRGTARSCPSSRYSAAVGATSPTVRPSGVVPGRVWVTRTAYAPGSISPSGASYTPGATWTSVDVARLEVRPDDDRVVVVEVARRAVGLDALDVQRGLAARRVERRLDAAGLLARERPRHELAEEPREAVPADPVACPAPGRVGRPRDGPPQAVLPLGEERIVARRHEHGLRGGLGRRPVVAAQPRQALVEPAQDRRGATSGSGRTAPRRSAGRRPAGSP